MALRPPIWAGKGKLKRIIPKRKIQFSGCLKVKSRFFRSLTPTEISARCSPKRSCQATTVYWPGGNPEISVGVFTVTPGNPSHFEWVGAITAGADFDLATGPIHR